MNALFRKIEAIIGNARRVKKYRQNVAYSQITLGVEKCCYIGGMIWAVLDAAKVQKGIG